MDFLDPKKQRAHEIRLFVGYVLIGLAILISTIILLYQAYGFGIDRDGEVVQNGVVFVASQPNGAEILLNNKPYKDTTNSRLQLPEGEYDITVRREGYHPWQRKVEVNGGSVSRYDYPLLVPTTLATAPVKNYAAAPPFATQSPDRRWLLVQQPATLLAFDMYDLGDPETVAAQTTSFSVPQPVITNAETGEHSWKLVEWSTNNRHLVVEHAHSGGMEYVLIDREEPERSLNLSRTLGLTAGQVLTLRDKKFDKYYIFDPAAKTVSSGSVPTAAVLTPVLTGVLAFKPYGENILLYATEAGAPAGKVLAMLRDGDVTYKIRELGAGGPYLLDLARYDGEWYVAVGASVENKTYIFRNPQAVRKSGRVVNLAPIHILRVTAPNFLAFSSNTRFVMIENATSFAVYDAETNDGYAYATAKPLDTGITHATWMDGHRITYVSEGKAVIFDYDNRNFQALSAATPAHLPFFDRDYRNLYTVAPGTAGQSAFTATPLLTAEDL
jgi:hypothetical protein